MWGSLRLASSSSIGRGTVTGIDLAIENCEITVTSRVKDWRLKLLNENLVDSPTQNCTASHGFIYRTYGRKVSLVQNFAELLSTPWKKFSFQFSRSRSRILYAYTYFCGGRSIHENAKVLHHVKIFHYMVPSQ